MNEKKANLAWNRLQAVRPRPSIKLRDACLSHVSVHDSYRNISISIFVRFFVCPEEARGIHPFGPLGGCRSQAREDTDLCSSIFVVVVDRGIHGKL